MNEIITNILLFIIVIIIHEIGHGIAFFVINKKVPTFKLHWWGIQAGNQEENRNITILNKEIVTVSGIFAGLLAMGFLKLTSDSWFLIYFGLCLGDIIILYSIFTSWKGKEYYYNLKDMRFLVKYKGKIIKRE